MIAGTIALERMKVFFVARFLILTLKNGDITYAAVFMMCISKYYFVENSLLNQYEDFSFCLFMEAAEVSEMTEIGESLMI